MSINDVITGRGKAWEGSRATRTTEIQGGLVSGEVLFFIKLCFRKAFFGESNSRLGQIEVTKFLKVLPRRTKSCNISWAGRRTAWLAQGDQLQWRKSIRMT